MSPYTMGLTALNTWRFPIANGFGIHHTMNADPYRGPWVCIFLIIRKTSEFFFFA